MEDNVERVIKADGKYALLYGTLIMEYYINRHCNLALVGEPLNDRSYALVLPHGKRQDLANNFTSQ